jgi:hypothetical protein
MEAFWMLLKADVLAKTEFVTLHRYVDRKSTRVGESISTTLVPAVLGAVNRACRYYPKSPACLQRSLALTEMLRKRGIAADLEIGVRQPPFESHAWVEVAGRVINDVEAVREVYTTIHEFKASEAMQRGM